ncbi:Cell division control protein 3 [Nosema granulosis]|uniref:Cell division control protein 3 n=1 Tax=Nosema granulosis TaxID=83296 RepID=A0A9P6GZS6_9MICR|nr:Cell division control protein 3 [Nosema granulosis]
MNQRGIGVSNLPNIKYRSMCRTGIDFNIMIVGSHGVGKTSFINGLLGTKIITEIEDAKEASDTMNFQISHFTVFENEFSTRVTVTEVDRIGDFEDNTDCWRPVTKLINDNYEDYLNSEHKSVRSLIHDKRIHVCFYCLEPLDNFIRPADTTAMREISKYCNLIPIVCKSDFLDDNQIQKAFDFLRETIESNNITIFEEQNPTRGSISNFIPPFFVISPKTTENGLSYVREYPWGQLNIQKIHSNDLFRLREKLINHNIIRLIEGTEEYYDRYRASVLSFYISKKTNKKLNSEALNLEIFEKLKNEENTIKEIKKRISDKKREYDNKLKTSLVIKEEES